MGVSRVPGVAQGGRYAFVALNVRSLAGRLRVVNTPSRIGPFR